MLPDCHDVPLGRHFGRAKTGSLLRHFACWVGRMSTSLSTCARARRTSAPNLGTAARAGSSIPWR